MGDPNTGEIRRFLPGEEIPDHMVPLTKEQADALKEKSLQERMADLRAMIQRPVGSTATSTSGAPPEMPRYKSHKVVWALKIKDIILDSDVAAETNRETDGSVTLIPAEEGFGPIKLGSAFLRRHAPHVGGYYVVYKDGYQSFSPAKAFAEGYVPIGDHVVFAVSDAVVGDVVAELAQARATHAPMNGHHEGYAVLLEELDELWEVCKMNTHKFGSEIAVRTEQRIMKKAAMRKEAIQVAAMAIRFIQDVCDK